MARHPLRRILALLCGPRGKTVAVGAAALGIWLFAWTAGTLPTLGDEARHYRRAINYYEAPLAAFRVTHDPAYPSEGPGRIVYPDPALWHQGLALAWKAVGRPSLVLAQLYHVVFFVALVVLAFLVGRELSGARAGAWTAALVATVPLNILLAMTFYAEVPMLAWMAGGVYAVLKRRPAWAGAAFAGALLTKQITAVVLIGPLALAAFLLLGTTWRQRAARGAVAGAVFALLILPDLLWRYEHFGQPFILRITSRPPYSPVLERAFEVLPSVERTAVPLGIHDPLLTALVLGATGLVAFGGVVFGGLGAIVRAIGLGAVAWRTAGPGAAARTLADDRSRIVWVAAVPALLYALVFFLMMPHAYDLRYLQPLALFGAWLAAPVLAGVAWPGPSPWPRRLPQFAVAALAVLAVAQAALVPAAVRARRTLDPKVADAYAWIRTHTEPDARIMYLEESLTALTGRPIFWTACVPRFIFGAAEVNQVRLWAFLELDYLAIHPTRRIDIHDPAVEPMGFPRPWIASLGQRPYIERVYPEGELRSTAGHFLLYRIDYGKVPAEWLDGRTR